MLKLQGCKPHGWRRDLLTNNSGWWNVKYFLFVHHYPGEDEAILTVLIFFNWIGLVQPPTSNPLILTFEISTGPSKRSVPLPPGHKIPWRSRCFASSSCLRGVSLFGVDARVFQTRSVWFKEKLHRRSHFSTHLRSRRFADREEGEVEAGLPRPSRKRWCVSPSLARAAPVPVPKPPPSVPPKKAHLRCQHALPTTTSWMLPKWWKERGDSQNCRLKTWKIVFFLTRSRCRWTDVVWKEIPLVFILGIHISIHKYVANIYVQNSRKLWQSLSQKHINPIWAVPSWPWLFAVYQGSETSQWYFKGNPNYKTTPTKQQGCKKMELLTTKVSFNAVDGRNPAPPGMYKTM